MIVLRVAFLFLLTFLITENCVYATLVKQPSQKEYDFIIIGGGTAGSVIASRLTEDNRVSALVIEAGIDNTGILFTEVPFLATALPGTSVDWNYTTIPQAGLYDRPLPLERGFVLGGSSSVNYMTWNRCSNDFWNSMAKAARSTIWSWREIEPYYMKTSSLVAPTDQHDTTGQVDPTVHGHGPVQVSLPGFKSELEDRIIGSAHLLGGRFSYNKDVNAGNPLGIGYVQNSIGNGTRSSAATSYLQPIIDRTNLEVIIMTRVTRLFGSRRSAHIDSVEISISETGLRTIITARNEIILSSGVMGTPQILSLSGIGPRRVLKPLGIDVLVDAPAVGANLVDHPLIGSYFSVNSTNTWDIVLRNQTVFQSLLDEWLVEKQGLFVNTPANTIGFFKMPDFHKFDPATGPTSANTEIFFSNGFAPFGTIAAPTNGSYLTGISAVLSPTSRGQVTINSTNPFDAPIIDLGILGTDYDIKAAVQSLKDVQTIVGTHLWKGYVLDRFGDLADANDDASLADYVRKNAVTVNHAVGTARIGEVVDSELKVIGVTGLRVVDASILHTAPECHPQALVYTIAERAAQLIKEEHNCDGKRFLDVAHQGY